MKKELLLWKIIAFGAVALYIYKVARANGGTLNGTPLQNLNPEKVSAAASSLFNPEIRPYIQKGANIALNHFLKGLK